MYPGKEKNNSMAVSERVIMLKRKIDRLKAMIVEEKERFLKEDLRARKMEAD